MAIDSAREEAARGAGRLARRLAFAGGGLALLLLAAALVLPYLVDAGRYRERIAAMASEASGREVVLGGAMSARLLPSPALSAADVTLANLEGGAAPFMARLERLDIVLALLPLLRGEIRVRRIELVGPEIALERLADGRVNWRLGAAAGESAASPSRRVELENATLRRGLLSWSDAVSGERLTLDDVEARLVARLPSGPFDIEARAVSAGVPLTLDLESRELVEGARTPFNARLGIGDAALVWSGHVRPGPAGALPGAGGKLALDGPSLAALLGDAARIAGTPPPAAGGLDKRFSLATAVTFDGVLEVADIAFRLGETVLSGSARVDPAGGPEIAVDLRADRLVLDDFVGAGTEPPRSEIPVGDSLLPPGIKLDLALALDALRWRDGTVSRLRLRAEGRDGALEVVEASARTPGAGKIALTGRATARDGVPAFAGRVEADAGDLPALLGWLGVGNLLAGEDVFGFALAAGMDLDPGRLALAGLELRLDRMAVEGDLALARAGAGWRLDGDLAADRLELDRWLPRDPEAPPASLADLADGLDRLLRSSRPHGGRLALRAGRVDLAGDSFGEVAVAAAVSDGVLTVEEARIGRLPGGSAFLTGRIAAGPPEGLGPDFDLALRLAGDDPASLARLAGFDLPVPSAALAPLDIEGTMAGTIDSIAFDLTAGVAGGRLTARGTVGQPAAAAPGPIDLEIGFAHPSHRALAERLDLAALNGGEALPLRLRAHLGGDATALALRLDGAALGGSLSVAGEIGDPYGTARGDLILGAGHPSLDRLLRQFDPTRSQRTDRARAVSATARYTGHAGGFALADIALAAGDSDLGGRIEVATDGPRPRFDADLSAGLVDLADFLAPESDGAAAGEGRAHTPFALDRLKTADGRLRLRVERLVHEPWQVDGLDLAADLAEGVLAIERLEGGLFGGRLAASGQLDARGLPAFDLALRLGDVGFGPLLAAATGLDFAAGRLDLEGSFTGRGANRAAMLAGLDGEARIAARQLALEGIDLPRLAAGIGTAARASDLPGLFRTALAGGRTPFRNATLGLRAEDGRLVGDDLEAVGERYRLRAGGAIDLAARSVEARGEVVFTGHAGAPPLGFVALGNLSAPRLLFEDGPLRAWATRRLAGAVLQRIPLPERLPEIPEIVGAGDPPPRAPEQPETPPPDVMKRFLDALREEAGKPQPHGGTPR